MVGGTWVLMAVPDADCGGRDMVLMEVPEAGCKGESWWFSSHSQTLVVVCERRVAEVGVRMAVLVLGCAGGESCWFTLQSQKLVVNGRGWVLMVVLIAFCGGMGFEDSDGILRSWLWLGEAGFSWNL